jgi:hypothetical protein
MQLGLCSDFRAQKSFTLSTHCSCACYREIQQILVKLGDKEPSFIGSSKWIGAIELGFILDEYLGVGHKVNGWG